MHEKDFNSTTTYPFPCIVFELCRSAGVPICHIHVINTPSGAVDIGLIRDEANELDHHRQPRLEVNPLGENLAAMVDQD